MSAIYFLMRCTNTCNICEDLENNGIRFLTITNDNQMNYINDGCVLMTFEKTVDIGKSHN